jgi:hypothetical protein
MKREKDQEERMMSIPDLQRLFSISCPTATALMERLPHVNVAPPYAKKRLLRAFRRDVDAFIRDRRLQG